MRSGRCKSPSLERQSYATRMLCMAAYIENEWETWKMTDAVGIYRNSLGPNEPESVVLLTAEGFPCAQQLQKKDFYLSTFGPKLPNSPNQILSKLPVK